jgi:hypothetical protein
MKLKNRSETEVERWNNRLAFTPREGELLAGSSNIFGDERRDSLLF